MTQDGNYNDAFSIQDSQIGSSVVINQVDSENIASAEQLFGADNWTTIDQSGTGNESGTW